MKLDVNFVSQQQEPGERPILNDCGPACLSALTGLPLEKIYQAASLKPGDMMHMTQMLDTLTALRLPREHIPPLHLPDARRWLANGNVKKTIRIGWHLRDKRVITMQVQAWLES